MVISKDKYLGCFLGLALGDALGAPYEGGLLERLLWKFFARTPIGEARWTDDTQMSIDLAESILENQFLNPDDLASRFAASFDWTRGYGPAAAKLLKKIGKGEDWRLANRSIYPDGSLGNGGAMRSPVISLYYHDNFEQLKKAATLASSITHAHPLGIEGAVLISHATANALLGIGSMEILENTCKRAKSDVYKDKSSLAMYWIDKEETPNPREVRLQLGSGIQATDSCITAIYLAIRFRSKGFEEMIGFNRKCGGDVDTISSMSGAIWGAFNGVEALPQNLLMNLEQSKRLFSIASRLYELKDEN